MPRRLLSALLTLLLVAAVSWLALPPSSPAVVAPEPDGPAWWKGNLHTHTLWSDGDDFPENVAFWYRENGYHFLALTDHNKLSEGVVALEAKLDTASRAAAVDKARRNFGPAWVDLYEDKGKKMVKLKPLDAVKAKLEQPGKFLMVQAEEITHSFKKDPVHMNGINLAKVVKPLDGKSHEETIRVNIRQVMDQSKTEKRPMLAFLNHPNFQWGVRAEDMAPLDELKFFEVYNGHSGVKNYGDDLHASTERIWDINLALRLGKLKLPPLHGLATDDSHAYHVWGLGKTNPGRGWVQVRTPKLEADALVEAIQAGNFYASTGVAIKDFQRTGNEYVVTIRGEPGVTYTTEIVGTMKGTSFDSEPVVDAAGKELTRKYSPDIGKVLAKSNELTVKHKLTGNELYIRARITSSKPHPNPYAKGDFETAWLPPVVP